MSVLKSKKVLLYAATCALFGVILAGMLFYFHEVKVQSAKEQVFNPAKILSAINTEDDQDDSVQIEQMIGDAMKKYGTKAGFELIDEGEKEDIISLDTCHGFLHYVGHAAYAESHDFEKLLSIVEGTNCIGGYLHGIEAEIVLTSPNVVKDVQDFCAFQMEKHVNPGPCFHGVGHAATELYKYDIPKSLAMCDALGGGPEKDLRNCYRGIFSEIGNVATGYDGHTGMVIATKEIAGLDVKKPYAYCATFAEKYQSSCVSQLTKILISNLSPEKWNEVCINPEFGAHIQDICINITTGIYIRHSLSFADSATIPPILNSYSKRLRTIAMMGGIEAYSGYFADKENKDWHPFCDSFTDADDSKKCSELFDDVVNNNAGPWMEYDDIR